MTTQELDAERVATELLRALRGRRSQAAFARRLGFASNVPYTWESGRRFPSASTFLEAAGRVGIDPEEALARFAGPGWPRDERPVLVRLLEVAIGASARSTVASLAGVGPQALGRWTRGEAEPRLPDLMRVVDAGTRRLPDWIAAFVDPERVPSIRTGWLQLRAARTLVGSSPWAAAVLLCLELEGSRERGWIAEQLGIDVELEDATVDLLVRAGQVRRTRDRYVPVPVPPIDLRGAAPAGELKQLWAKVAAERGAGKGSPGDAGLVSWNLFAVSEADLAALRDIQRDAWRQMRRTVDGSGTSEVVALAHWTLCVLAR